MTKKERSARCRIACLWGELVGRPFFEGSAFSWRMASKNFGAEMASERWSLESTVINTSNVTVVEGEAGEGAICGVNYQFQSVTVTTTGDLKNRVTHVTRLIGLRTGLYGRRIVRGSFSCHIIHGSWFDYPTQLVAHDFNDDTAAIR